MKADEDFDDIFLASSLLHSKIDDIAETLRWMRWYCITRHICYGLSMPILLAADVMTKQPPTWCSNICRTRQARISFSQILMLNTYMARRGAAFWYDTCFSMPLAFSPGQWCISLVSSFNFVRRSEYKMIFVDMMMRQSRPPPSAYRFDSACQHFQHSFRRAVKILSL